MNFKKFLPHIVSLGIFVIVSLLYFHPVLKGQKMSQSDITQYIGMAKEMNDYRVDTGEEPYWAESAFSGMPNYQLGAYFPNDYVYDFDALIRFLPRPADYLFLYFLGFYILLLALKTNWKLAILGSLAFGFSTYLIIIFGAGHNAKAHAIAYMPMVLAGVLWVFQKRYLLGFTVTGFAMALEIKANHPQMTYYLLFAILILGIVELIEAIKKKTIPQFATQSAMLILAMILAVGVNATRLLSTKQYADYSTRGKSELTINPDGTDKQVTNGLSKDYITQYSYGIDETFNLLVPRYMGGGTVEKLGKDSHTYEFVKGIAGPKQADGFTEQVLTYWGQQPIVEAPAYIGAVIFFFFFLGMFLVRGKLKYWLVATTVFAILMSWGKNFEFLTNLFIDYVPLYNKFRAVSSIQVIAELCVPLLGILAIKEFFSKNRTIEQKKEALKKALYITGGLVVVGLFYASATSTFEGIRDGSYAQYDGLIDSVIADRKSMLYSDSFRSLVLIGLSFGVLWLFLKDKLNQTKAIIGFSILILFDLVQVNLRYVNADDFTSARRVDKPFVASEADKQIQKDKSHYRVANFAGDPFQDGRTSYFHKSIGGYHAAKMGRYQDLIEFQIDKNNFEVLNMLNVKYVIMQGQDGKQQVQQNPEANGNAWFVGSLKFVNSANEEIVALDSLKTKSVAVFDTSNFGDDTNFTVKADSTASIKLTGYSLENLKYESNATENQFAVFSEIYYKDGWNAYIDGELKPHYRVNYVLRGMEVPAGNHIIEFKFEPKVIQTGSNIALVSYAFLLLIPLGWFLKTRKQKREE
tara:strand:- start:4644 stop:7061 length:2418 start_codon:yes stop_codon:yes gene_type:complete